MRRSEGGGILLVGFVEAGFLSGWRRVRWLIVARMVWSWRRRCWGTAVVVGEGGLGRRKEVVEERW